MITFLRNAHFDENHGYLFKVFLLKPEEQLTLYYSLRDSLRERGILLH